MIFYVRKYEHADELDSWTDKASLQILKGWKRKATQDTTSSSQELASRLITVYQRYHTRWPVFWLATQYERLPFTQPIARHSIALTEPRVAQRMRFEGVNHSATLQL